jgi:outer membrane protein insertion porin family
MKNLTRAVLLALALAWLLPSIVPAQSGTVEQIEVQGLFRMTREAFLHALGIKVGDTYDERVIRARFKSLWDRGLFEDISIESEDGPAGGKVLIVKVRERPVLTSVTYEDNKVATRTQIEDRLRERDIPLKLGKPLDMGTVFFAESAIRDLLAEKGFLDAIVEAEIQRVTETSKAVHFKITPGGKTRIKEIEFVGNEIFSDRRLRGELELTEKRKWYWPWSQKSLYHPVKWDQDVSKIRQLYLSQGYLDVEIGAPRIEVREEGKQAQEEKEGEPEADAAPQTPAGPPPPTAVEPAPEADEPEPAPTAKPLTEKQIRKQEERQRKQEKKARKQEQKESSVKRWVHLSIPVREGQQYTLGEISISGNEVFPDELLRAMIPLGEGQVLRNDLLEFAIDRIRRMYEDRGHLYATVVRRLERREGENIADIAVVVDEDEPYFVGRIEFSGNTSTHDRVLRREMILAEGELFSRTKLDISRAKVNQLGYFHVPEDPVIEPIEGENRVDILMPGEERGRNEIQVGGGYSGIDGLFFNGVYSTRNFMGRGQIVSLALQVGGRSSRYQISFQEPWFMSRPYLLGVSLFRQETDYGTTLRSDSDGFGLVLGRRIGRWGNLTFSYNWRNVTSETVLLTVEEDVEATATVRTETTISSLTPVFTFTNIDNPYRPTRGRQFTGSIQIAGGPLGGDTSYLKPIVRFTTYRPATRKTFLGLHAELGWVREWQGGSPLSGSNIEGVPRFERFWLGGDTLGPRVFETRTITPRRFVEINDQNQIVNVIGDPRYISADDLVTSSGRPVLIEVGGDRYFLLQTEYVLPLNEQAEVAMFLDVGDALFEDQSWGFETARVSAGIELRFHLPIFPVPLRLIYGWPLRAVEGDRTSNFTFSIGRSF